MIDNAIEACLRLKEKEPQALRIPGDDERGGKRTHERRLDIFIGQLHKTDSASASKNADAEDGSDSFGPYRRARGSD